VEGLQKSGRALEDYQTMGAHLLGSMYYGWLNDEQGMGKTRAVVALLSSLQMWPVVVVTKASCKYGWVDEIRSVDPTLRVQVLDASTVPDKEAQIYVLNYDILAQQAKLTRQPLGVTIFDESQEMINTHTLRGKWSIVFAYAAQRCYLVTGTPMPSRTRDLFHQLKLLRSPISVNWRAYAERFCAGKDVERKDESADDPENNLPKIFFDSSGASNLTELGSIVGALTIRRLKKDFLNLPPKEVSFRMVSLPMGHPYWTAHKELRKARSSVAKLKAIGMTVAAAAVAKTPYTISLVRAQLEAGRKVVLFSGCIKAADALHQAFPKALRLKGGTAPLRRKEIQDKFQTDPSQRLIICALKSSGAGINLQSASVAIFNDLPWSPDITRQGEDRIHRIGSVESCQIIYVLARHTFDEVVQAVLNRKRNLQTGIEMWMESTTRQRTEQSMLFG
jgi:SWI/SNF-related matrix-associated actin-dependent regulator 1 of chromatin subfamily A